MPGQATHKGRQYGHAVWRRSSSARTEAMTESMRINIRKGLDLPLAGRPVQEIAESNPIRSVALLADDYHCSKPELHVAEGDRVVRGQALFEDRDNPCIAITSPSCGTVTDIHRGARRRLLSIVIRREGDEQRSFDAWPRTALDELDKQTVREQLLASGLWTAFRTRPFSGVPHTESVPAAIFVTAINTNPLATNPDVVIRAAEDESVGGGRTVCHGEIPTLPGAGGASSRWHRQPARRHQRCAALRLAPAREPS